MIQCNSSPNTYNSPSNYNICILIFLLLASLLQSLQREQFLGIIYILFTKQHEGNRKEQVLNWKHWTILQGHTNISYILNLIISKHVAMKIMSP